MKLSIKQKHPSKFLSFSSLLLLLTIGTIILVELIEAEGDDDSQSCMLTSDLTSNKISDSELRKYEDVVFGNTGRNICGRDMQEFIRAFRHNHENYPLGSRLLPKYQDIMDDIRWLDDINEFKCRVVDFYDRAAMVAMMSAKFPNLKVFLENKSRDQNKLCLEDLKSDMGDILEGGAYLTAEQLLKEKPEVSQKLTEKQKHKLIPVERQVANFLRYNLDTNKDDGVKLYEFIPRETYNTGVAEYLLPRARKLDTKHISGKNLREAQLKHYESEFNRLVFDACDSVHREMYQFKDYFENIMLIGNLPDTAIHQRIFEAISDIRVCELVVNKVYPFEGIYDAMTKIIKDDKEEAQGALRRAALLKKTKKYK